MMQVLNVCVDVFAGAGGAEGGIPSKIAYLVHLGILAIQIVVPILLIIWGMLDLGKAVVAQKEDEIKKGQQTFMKRIAAAAIVFFVVTIATLLINLISDDSTTITGCIDSIINCDNTSCVDKK